MAVIPAVQDDFFQVGNALESIRKAVAVVPNNTTNLGFLTRSLWIGTAGDVAVVFQGGDDTAPVIYKNVAGGQRLPIRVARVLSTGTTASNILAEA